LLLKQLSDHNHGDMTGNALRQAFLLTAFILVVEATAGLLSHSLALLADAGHNLGDVLGLSLSWGAAVLSPNINIAARHIGFVLQANGTTLADIYRVHLVVEPAAAKMVAETARKTAPPILRGCIEECRAKIDDDFAFGIATARFRNTLIELANVPVLTMLMGMLNHIFELAWGTVTATAGQQLDNAPDKRRGLRSMEKLIEYIEAGDGPGAEAHWHKHSEAAEKAMSKWLPAAKVVDILDE